MSTLKTTNIAHPSSASNNIVLDSSGRVLVGTSSARANFYNTSAAAALQIEGADSNAGRLSVTTNFSTATDGAAGQVVLSRSGSTTVGSNTLVANNNWLGLVSFQGADGTEFVEAAQIRAEVDGTPGANDMPGRLVFSTCPDNSATPVERMRIASSGNSGFFGGVVSHYMSAGNGTDHFFMGRDSSVVGAMYSGNYKFGVYTNGNVENSANSYGGISDIKLKENIVDAKSQWDDIKALRPVNYNFKPETGQPGHTQIGLIAQEVELVSPGLVNERPDRDAEGNDLGTVTKSVNYSVLYMKAVKALQEAMERIETLEQRLTDAGIA